MKKIIILFSIVVFSILPILLSSYLVIFNSSYFHNEFSKHGVVEKYEVNIDFYHREVIEYLRGSKTAMPDEIPLNEREISHMDDVRNVFRYYLVVFYLVLGLSIVLLLFLLKKDVKIIPKVFRISGFISIGISVVLLLFFLISFTFAFDNFHSLFFTEGSWVFSPTDNIVNIYPIGLFRDVFVRVFLIQFVISIVFVFPYVVKSFYKKIRKS